MATITKEKLTCEYAKKPHTWTREPTRGRKPRFCPKHVPEKMTPTSTELYCELGKHKWTREPTRGRVPTSCPEHRVTPVIMSAPRNENGMVTLHCEIGNHDWERAPQKGKRPANCPDHAANRVASDSPVSTEPKKRGRRRIHESKEEQDAAAIKRSQERAANLDSMLKERGTHVAQWAEPFILYKKVEEKAGRKGTPPTVTWEKAGEFSPLTSAQWVNAHEKEYADGLYRFERNSKVINLL